MRNTAFGLLLLWFAGTCFGQAQEPLCPRHIETPYYPPLARTANLSGRVTLAVTIDKNGSVTSAEPGTRESITQAHPVLLKSAVENIQHWTFVKPPFAPYTETVVYDYEFDQSLPPEGGKKSAPAMTTVSFDLPNRVTISTNMRFIDTATSRK
jgi:TonB family protein